MTQGQLIATWQDARLFAAAVRPRCFFWRRGILGTIVAGHRGAACRCTSGSGW